MKTIKKTGQDCDLTEWRQARSSGSDVLGMEYTTALPIGSRNAEFDPIMPGHTWAEGGMAHTSKTKGKSA